MAVAATTAGGKVLNFLACPFDALGSTMATYGAQNVGASRYDRLNRGLFASSAMGFAYSALAFCIAWFFGRMLTGLFVSGEGSEELIGLARQYMIANVSFYPLLTLVNVVRFTIQGMGFSMFAILGRRHGDGGARAWLACYLCLSGVFWGRRWAARWHGCLRMRSSCPLISGAAAC